MLNRIVYKNGRTITKRGDASIEKMLKQLGISGLTIVIQKSKAAMENARNSRGVIVGYFDPNKMLVNVLSYGRTRGQTLNTVAHELGHAYHYLKEYSNFKKCTSVQREYRAHEVQAELGYPHTYFDKQYYVRKDRKAKRYA